MPQPIQPIFMPPSARNRALLQGKPGWRQAIAPPFHFQTTPAPGSYNLQEPLAAFEIRYIETLHEGFEVTRDSRVVLVELPPPEGNED